MKNKKEKLYRLNDQSPEGIAYRKEQARIESELEALIEGVPDDPGSRQMIEEMDRRGCSEEEIHKKITEYHQKKQRELDDG